jgi:hypothetical protein
MSWFVDNANALYVLLGVVAAGMAFAWRRNRQVKFLGYAAGPLVLIGLLLLMTRVVVSDAKQLELNVHAMADAVVAGNVDELFKHISKDFRFKEMTRDTLYAKTQRTIKADRIKYVQIKNFNVDEIARDKKLAKTRFRVIASADQESIFVTQADFVLEGDQWKLKTMRFYNPFVNQDQEIDLPGLR